MAALVDIGKTGALEMSGDLEAEMRQLLARPAGADRPFAPGSLADAGGDSGEARKAEMLKAMSHLRQEYLARHKAARSLLARRSAQVRQERQQLQERARQLGDSIGAMKDEIEALVDRLEQVSSLNEAQAARVGSATRRLSAQRLCLTEEERTAKAELLRLQERLAELRRQLQSARHKCSSLQQSPGSPGLRSPAARPPGHVVLTPKQFASLSSVLKDESGKIQSLIKRAKNLEECVD